MAAGGPGGYGGAAAFDLWRAAEDCAVAPAGRAAWAYVGGDGPGPRGVPAAERRGGAALERPGAFLCGGGADDAAGGGGPCPWAGCGEAGWQRRQGVAGRGARSGGGERS